MSERRAGYGIRGQAEPENAQISRCARPGRLSLVLPYPPSVNHIWRRGRNGNTYKSEEGKQYDQRVSELVWHAALGLGWSDITTPLRLTVELFPPDGSRSDTDNRVKALQDAVFRGLGLSDWLVTELHVYRRWVDRTNPRAEVVLEAA